MTAATENGLTVEFDLGDFEFGVADGFFAQWTFACAPCEALLDCVAYAAEKFGVDFDMYADNIGLPSYWPNSLLATVSLRASSFIALGSNRVPYLSMAHPRAV